MAERNSEYAKKGLTISIMLVVFLLPEREEIKVTKQNGKKS